MFSSLRVLNIVPTMPFVSQTTNIKWLTIFVMIPGSYIFKYFSNGKTLVYWTDFSKHRSHVHIPPPTLLRTQQITNMQASDC